MKIGCVTRHNYPCAQEIRVTKLATTLQSHGHEVVVFCPGDVTSASESTFEHGRVVRMVQRKLGGLGRGFFSPLPLNLLWMVWLAKQFTRNELDIVIVRDLRLALPTFFAARLCGIKAIMDLGEHYPGMMEILGKQKLTHHILRNHHLITMLEAVSVKSADLVWVVVDENKQRLGRYSQSIEVINNYPMLSNRGVPQIVEQREYSDDCEPIVLISLGLIDNIRGLDLAIDALAILIRTVNNIQLHIYGDGFYKKNLEDKVRGLHLESHVKFCGWVPEDRKYEVLMNGDIGLLLHKVCDLTQHTVPNKLFDYMCVGLPVLATPLRPVARIIELENCGLIVDEDAKAIADGMKKLVTSVQLRRMYGRNGYDAVYAKYTWDSEAKKIVDSVNAMVRQ